jgi:hypothetical protein
MAENTEERPGAVRPPAAFTRRVMALSGQPLDFGLLQFDREELGIIRDALRAAAIDRAPREPHDNHMVRNLFRLARVFSDLADQS